MVKLNRRERANLIFVGISHNLLDCSLDVLDEANAIMFDVCRGKLFMGDTLRILACGVFYLACRKCNAPYSLEQVSQAGGCYKHDVMAVYKKVSRKFDIKVELVSPIIYVDVLVRKLDLGDVARDKAVDILRMAEGKFDGAKPILLAGVALYVGAIFEGRRLTWLQVANATDTTVAGLARKCRELLVRLDLVDDVARMRRSNNMLVDL